MDVYSRTRSAANEKSNVDILLHSAGHPKLDYVAREEKAGDVQSLLQHYLAIHDPETGDTQVVPARRLVLRSMLQSARMPEEIEEKTPARKSVSQIVCQTARQLTIGRPSNQEHSWERHLVPRNPRKLYVLLLRMLSYLLRRLEKIPKASLSWKTLQQ